MVVNPKSLVKELSYLHEEGVTTDNLRISDRAHVILPYHIELDRLQEEAKRVKIKLVLLSRVSDQLIWIRLLVLESVLQIFWIKRFSVNVLERNLAEKNRQFVKLYDSEPISFDDIFEEYL